MIPPCKNCGQDNCHFCHLARTNPKYANLYRQWDQPFLQNACAFRGEENGRIPCESCGGNIQIKTFDCSKHGSCSLEKPVGVATCAICPDKKALDLQAAYDWHDLGAAVPGDFRKFNSSLLRFDGQLILATRVHAKHGWSMGKIVLSKLDNAFQRQGANVELRIDHPAAEFGIEDPRLFVHAGKLHIGFTGVQRDGDSIRTHQLYARLGSDLQAEEVFLPDYDGRQHWEKNWGFFSEGGQLYAVYQIAGHQILRIDGNRAERAYASETAWPQGSGIPRGGSSPVKRGNEWYGFYHDVTDRERRHYTLCVYTFEDKPPFRINRIGRVPLFAPDKKHRPDTWTPDVVFPCGAFLEDNLWHVSAGYYDKWSWLLRFDVNKLEVAMDIAAGGRDAAYHFRDNVDDLDVWQNVYNRNEYELPERIDGWQVVDVGGHIGSFARLCLDRGAAHVCSIEAHPGQQEMYRKNLEPHAGKWTLVPAAVFGKPPRETATLVGRGCIAKVLGESDRTGGDPVTDSQEVPTVALGPVQCDLMKMDVEGCEYEILGNTDLSGVKRICGEGHLFDGLPGIQWLRGLLEGRGYRVTIRETGPLTFLFWADSISQTAAHPP